MMDDFLEFDFEASSEEDLVYKLRKRDPSVNYLWRLSNNNCKCDHYFHLKNDTEDGPSLFGIKEGFIETHKYLDEQLIFIFFMYSIIYHSFPKKDKNHIAIKLYLSKIEQYANSSNILREKINNIKMTEKQSDKYSSYATHWIIEYTDNTCQYDEEVVCILTQCIDIFQSNFDSIETYYSKMRNYQ